MPKSGGRASICRVSGGFRAFRDPPMRRGFFMATGGIPPAADLRALMISTPRHARHARVAPAGRPGPEAAEGLAGPRRRRRIRAVHRGPRDRGARPWAGCTSSPGRST
jgi:hypothetical protein